MVRRMLVAAGALALPVWSAGAYCSKPIVPYCAARYGQFTDQYELERCRSDLELYRGEVETYRSCLEREQEEAVRELQNAVESFNRRAQG